MAHPPRVKGHAFALLLTGETIAATAKATGVPKQTIFRWKSEAFKLARRALSQTPEGRQFLEEIKGLELSGVCNSRDPKRSGKIRIDIAIGVNDDI